MLRSALDDFVRLGMPQEAAAVAADLARVISPDTDAIRTLAKDLRDRLDSRLALPDAAERSSAYRPIREALERLLSVCARADIWRRSGLLDKAIEGLRDAAGSDIACLVRQA